jgi:xanthine dehydrogenase accessory factor
MTTFPLPADVHQAVVDFADAGKAFALVVVLKDAGSTPRKAGTKAIVDAEGSIWGTIGGGLLESEARRRAVEAIRTRRPVVFDFKFSGTRAAEGDPVCGGTMRVLVDPTADAARAVYARAAEARRRREHGTLVTTVRAPAGGAPAEVLVEWQGPDAPPPEPAAADVLVEPIVSRTRLLVVGGGHVGQALVRQASLVGFDVVVIEDRPGFSEPALFPEGVTIRNGDVADELKGLLTGDGADTCVALVSRGHLVDAKALGACIHKPAAYIGMMGSRRKVALLRKDFIESGRATAAEFDRVYAPIGLEIGAETVQEIAASIVAQVIEVLRKGSAPRWGSAGAGREE